MLLDLAPYPISPSLLLSTEKGNTKREDREAAELVTDEVVEWGGQANVSDSKEAWPSLLILDPCLNYQL